MTAMRLPVIACVIGLMVPVIALGGCSQTRSGQSLDATLTDVPLIPPDQWASELPDTKTNPEESEESSASWIERFGSDQLIRLTGMAVENNFSLASTQAQMRAIYQSVAAARALGRPQLGASISGGSQLTSFANPAAQNNDRQQEWSQLLQWNITASWEADIWGRISAQTGAALADATAAHADLTGAELALRGSVASTWINLSNAIAQRDLAQNQLHVRTRSLELTERRFASGLSTALDVRLARSAEASARAEIADAQRNLSDLTGRLQTLVGLYPSGQLDQTQTPPALTTLAPMPDIADPETILNQRPDILASQARVHAAGLRIKAARAAVRPSLGVDASFGVSENDVARLFDISYIAGRILASLTAPIYRGGQLAAEQRRTRALAESAAANYAQTVLDAWREVENARIADLQLEDAEEAYHNALTEARAAESLAERQYQNGLISIFNLLDAQTSRIGAERAFNATRAARYLNRVAYHLALGGDTQTNSLIEPKNAKDSRS